MDFLSENLELFPDESVSSWMFRNRYLPRGTIGMPAGSRDRDFGNLQFNSSRIPESLRVQLQRAAMLPDPWLLRPGDRQYCARCWAEDWVSGQPLYARRAWRIAWHTCCRRHGLYLQNRGLAASLLKIAHSRPLLGILHPAWSAPAEIHFYTLAATEEGFQLTTSIRLPIVGRRAVHLENALSTFGFSAPHPWRPSGLDAPTLRHAYASIVKILVKQFSLDLGLRLSEPDPRRPQEPKRSKSMARNDLGSFFLLNPEKRFSINVLAEAIFSTWSSSPLPNEAGPHARTKQLVKDIGWEHGVPGAAQSGFNGLPSLRKPPNSPVSSPLLRGTLAADTTRPQRDKEQRLREMACFYQGNMRVAGIVRYYESKKIKEKRDL